MRAIICETVENVFKKRKNAGYQHFLLFPQDKGLCSKGFMKVTVFSSPEHRVLMVSFCDHPMSVVRHPSCVVHNFFKHLLLLNHWANLDET